MLTDWRVSGTASIFCTGVLLTCIETNAQSMPPEIASRVEIYAIPSLTISDQQFLTGDTNGKQVTVAGEFRIAQGAGHAKPPRRGQNARLERRRRFDRAVGAPVQRDGDLDFCDRRFLRPR